MFILWALVAFACFGVSQFLTKFAVDRCGWLGAAVLWGLTQSILTLGLTLVLPKKILATDAGTTAGWISGGVFWAALAAVIGTVGGLAYNYAITKGSLSVTSAVADTYPILVVLLAVLFLREDMRPLQWIGFAFSIAGILMVSLGGNR